MKDKSKVLKTYGYMFDKLQFVCLIAVYRFLSILDVIYHNKLVHLLHNYF